MSVTELPILAPAVAPEEARAARKPTGARREYWEDRPKTETLTDLPAKIMFPDGS